MTNILKLRQGRSISRAEYAKAKSEFDDFYQNADEDTRAKLDGLLQSSLNYSSADPMNNRSAREYATQIYKNAVKIGKGEYAEAPGAVASTKNIFNGYSNAENINNANYITSRYLSNIRSSKPASTPSSSQNLYHEYNWAKGLDSGWGLETDTLEDRMSSFANTLASNLREAKNAKASGRDLVGISESTINQALAFLNKKTWTKDDFRSLMNAAKIAGVDPSAFKNYFGDLFPGVSPEDKAKTALKNNGFELIDNYDFGDYANDFSNYKVAKKGNEYYLINPDYSGVATNVGKVFMNTDWRNPDKEGHGYIIGNDGSFIIGDLNSHRNDERYKNQIESYLKNLDNENRWVGNKSKFNKFTSLSDSDLLNNFADDLHGQNIADLSRYFDGQDVIATVNGNNFDGLRSQYGHLRIDDPNLTFYYRSKDGLKKGTYQDIIRDLGDITLQSNKAAKGLQNFQSIDYNLDGLDWSDERDRGDIDINRESEWYNWWSPNRELKNGWNNEISASDTSMNGKNSGITNDPGKFARLMLYAYANSDKLNNSKDKNEKELSHALNNWLKNDQTKANLIYVIYELMSMHPEQFKDPRYRTAFQQLLMSTKGSYSGQSKSTEVTQMQKEGGILKAAMGAGLDVNGNPIPVDPKESIAASMRDRANLLTNQRNKLVQQAEENGRTTKQQLEVNRNAWTSSDTLRATALATDIAGLIAAISSPATGGVGSLIAVGSGFASMAQDAIADFTDEKVSKGQAWKNVAINSGLAVGAMFGAKAPKMVKSAMKIVPKAMMALGAAGVVMDPEVQKTVDKITSGKGLNVNDWKNISIILRTATGIATVGTMSYKGKKGAAYAKEVENQKLQEITSDLDPNIKYIGAENGKKAIPINKDLHADITKKLSSGKEDDINDALATLMKSKEQGGAGLSEADAKSVLLESAKKKKGLVEKLKFWKEPETETTLREATTEQIENLTGRDLRADAKLAAIEDIRAKAESHKSALLNKLEGTKLVESLNPALNQALAGTQYKNIRELVSGEKAKLPAYRPSQKGNNFASLTPEENNLFVKDVAGEMHTESDAQKSALNIEGLRKNAERSQRSLDRLERGKSDLEQERQEYIDRLLRLDNELQEAKRAKITAGEKQEKIANILSQIDEISQQIASNEQLISNYRGSKGFKNYLALVDSERTARQAIDSNSSIKNLIQLNSETGRYELVKGVSKQPKTLVRQAKLLISEHTKAIDALERAQKTAKGSPSSAARNHSAYREAVDYNRKNKGTIASLEKELAELKKELTGISESINAKNQELRVLGAEYRSRNYRQRIARASEAIERRRAKTESILENVKSTTELIRGAVQELKVKSIASRGRDLGNTQKSVTVKLEGVDTKINSGTNTKSYTAIRDRALAKKAALQGRPNAKELSQEDIRKIYPSNMLSGENAIRGAAYDPTANELVIWQKGGKIDSKYSHLRK